MKKLACLIAFIAVLIVLSGCVGVPPAPGNGPTLAEMQVCSADLECVLVDRDCCGCRGGTMVSINESFLQQYNDKFLEICKVIDIACPAIMSEDPSCSPDAIPVCSEGKCSFELSPPPAPVDIYFQPMQCQGIPWSETLGKEGGARSYYLENYDVEILSIEEICENIVVCQACDVCPTQCYYKAVVDQTDRVKMLTIGWVDGLPAGGRPEYIEPFNIFLPNFN